MDSVQRLDPGNMEVAGWSSRAGARDTACRYRAVLSSPKRRRSSCARSRACSTSALCFLAFLRSSNRLCRTTASPSSFRIVRAA
jgi:hypothetical protein